MWPTKKNIYLFISNLKNKEKHERKKKQPQNSQVLNYVYGEYGLKFLDGCKTIYYCVRDAEKLYIKKRKKKYEQNKSIGRLEDIKSKNI